VAGQPRKARAPRGRVAPGSRAVGYLCTVPGHLSTRGCSLAAYWEHVAASKGLDEDERLVSGERLVMYGVYSHS
jgi:hypothetical protein